MLKSFFRSVQLLSTLLRVKNSDVPELFWALGHRFTYLWWIRQIHLQQEAGICHGVFKNLTGSVVVVDLHVQISKRGAALHRFKLEFSGWSGHPLAAGLPVTEKLKEFPGFRKALAEAVCEDFAFCHLSVPPFKYIFLKSAKAVFGQKKNALIWVIKSKRKMRGETDCSPRNANMDRLTAYKAPVGDKI